MKFAPILGHAICNISPKFANYIQGKKKISFLPTKTSVEKKKEAEMAAWSSKGDLKDQFKKELKLTSWGKMQQSPDIS